MSTTIRKFTNPQKIEGNVVIIVAVIGLFGNLFSVLLLKKGSKENINIKSSYLHMVSDALSSVAVIIAGVVIKYLSIYWIDPVLTVFINIIIVKSSYEILKESINILMQGTPLNIDIDEINNELSKIGEIKGIHHIHVWRLDENNNVLEGHVQVQDMLISESSKINNEIEHILKEHFDINHTVIQFESINCQGDICQI
jgi:cobalt-zinc-cadmium efflux system protein